MAVSKTMTGLRPQQAASAAYKQILKSRLAYAGQRLQLLDGHAESVHQLRVSTRRAAAALRLAENLLPAKRFDRTGELLRRLRRAAGPVRDVDIYLEAVHSSNLNDHAKDFLTGHMAATRAVGFARLAHLASESLPELRKLSTSLVVSIDGRHREPIGGVLAAVNAKLTRRLGEALAEATEKPTSRRLHALRICGKRLRYTMELLPEIHSEKSLALIEELQSILGEWHDAHIMLGHLAEAKFAASAVNGSAGSPVMKGITTLEKLATKAMAAKLSALKKWAKQWQASAKRNAAAVS